MVEASPTEKRPPGVTEAPPWATEAAELAAHGAGRRAPARRSAQGARKPMPPDSRRAEGQME